MSERDDYAINAGISAYLSYKKACNDACGSEESWDGLDASVRDFIIHLGRNRIGFQHYPACSKDTKLPKW